MPSRTCPLGDDSLLDNPVDFPLLDCSARAADQMKNEEDLRETAVASQDKMRAFFILRGAEPSGFPRDLSSFVFIHHDPIFEKVMGHQKKFIFLYYFGARRARCVCEACAMRARWLTRSV
jgi:hypothetical protein